MSTHTRSLYDPTQAERDACGVGFVASTTGDRRSILPLALEATQRLAHRGAVGADQATGDGAGILTQIPRRLFAQELGRAQVSVDPDAIGVGSYFLPQQADVAARFRQLAEEVVAAGGSRIALWREVPVRPEHLGAYARATCPRILQSVLVRPPGEDPLAFERRLYRLRRTLERRIAAEALDTYVVSLSGRTLVYKGLLLAGQLPHFYPDLIDPDYETAFAVYHQRYSTNTTPTWRRTQPFRLLAHNGEINTIQGNERWMQARANAHPQLRDLAPWVDPTNSDSGMLDNALELLTLAGRDLPHAVMMLMPEAWEGSREMPAAVKAFYRFHSALIEPWDGPAAVCFADGHLVGASLDRNGLRPMRYTLTKDGLVIAGSETGVAPVLPENVRHHGKLGPGQMIVVDTRTGRFFNNAELKGETAGRKPYGEWLERQMIPLSAPPPSKPAPGTTRVSESIPADKAIGTQEELMRAQVAFGYTSEELITILRPMAEDAKEPVGSMGDDTALAALSLQNRPLFHYFKQRFAEVTNPPIDPLREATVFSLRTLLGPRAELFAGDEAAARLLELPSPILLDDELRAVCLWGETDSLFQVERLPAVFPVTDGPEGLLRAVRDLQQRAAAAVDRGARILILSDRSIGPDRAPIPSLMAVGAVHHHLIQVGQRMAASIVVESGEPREVHHMATLIGYGAAAVNPYLALASVKGLRTRLAGVGVEALMERFRKACEDGLLKVMSKMGISTVDSYCGAQIFEAVGISPAVIEICFPGTPSVVAGNDFTHIAQNVLELHQVAYGEQVPKLASYGFYKPRRGGEHHDFTPETAKLLHQAVGLGEGAEQHDAVARSAYYKEWVRAVRAQPSQLRDALEFCSDRRPIPVGEVEPLEAIVKRFSTAQMSLGALSPEAHEVLALAMNRLGARSGSGEGGEEVRRLGSISNSAVKQIASGRFGVTPAYLASALELQIKMAQGSKPGEGGQIPGHKVTDLIARLRHTVPGVALISPPPHHDIYSIEDLAQLIYDLKCVNPRAEVSVKLVSQTGVGIIASGVVKGYADIVVISGHAGGTGSSPLSSIKNAGLPWEIGLAETQQALLANGLRDRVALRADGGMKTGRDVVMAALLGADEYSFGTTAMIAEGCVMARVCHTNNCPVGVASQRPELRAKFAGTPDHVIRLMWHVAEEVRQILADLGYRTVGELVGRVELLRQTAVGHPAFDRLDLSPLLHVPTGCERGPRRRVAPRNTAPAPPHIDGRLIAQAQADLNDGRPIQLSAAIQNTDRTVGATLSGWVVAKWGPQGLPEGTVRVALEGTAGQSFGAFLCNGIHLILHGEANDYVGKGMAGGEIVIRPHPSADLTPHENVIIGNTALYGATAGRLFAAGRAGERFAVRNSGCVAVVEGVGDHGCEYMTGGVVVVLGRTGPNFGAGMTGGQAFVYDEDSRMNERINPSLVATAPLTPSESQRLRQLVLAHAERTNSLRAAHLLASWETAKKQFVKIEPLAEPRPQEEPGAAEEAAN